MHLLRRDGREASDNPFAPEVQESEDTWQARPTRRPPRGKGQDEYRLVVLLAEGGVHGDMQPAQRPATAVTYQVPLGEIRSFRPTQEVVTEVATPHRDYFAQLAVI
jgi:hypothetical protein